MDIANIQDVDSLQSWLKDRSVDEANQIVIRCALRAFPMFGSAFRQLAVQNSHWSGLTLLRLLFSAGVARSYPNPLVKVAAGAALTDAKFDVQGFGRRADAALEAALAAARCAISDVAKDAIEAASIAAVAALEAYNGEGLIWTQIREDARMIERGQNTLAARLWSDGGQEFFQGGETETRAAWTADRPGTWDFWQRWWDGVLAGTPLTWELQRDILLELTEEDWQSGPARVAERIAEIELRYAILRTPNAEAIRVNPETGFVRTDPVSHLPADHLEDIVDTLLDASKVFEGHGGPNGPYGAFEDECKIVEDAADRYARRPIMLLRICRRVVERVKIKEANGDCPKNDPLVADFVSSIASAAGDLMAFDQDVREAETARVAGNSTPPSPSIAKALVFAADQSGEISEGALKIELPADARLAISAPSTFEGQVALYQTKSRLLRLLEITKSNGKGAVEHVERYPVVYTSVTAILLFLVT